MVATLTDYEVLPPSGNYVGDGTYWFEVTEFEELYENGTVTYKFAGKTDDGEKVVSYIRLESKDGRKFPWNRKLLAYIVGDADSCVEVIGKRIPLTVKRNGKYTNLSIPKD